MCMELFPDDDEIAIGQFQLVFFDLNGLKNIEWSDSVIKRTSFSLFL